jgi:hypothetical protein
MANPAHRQIARVRVLAPLAALAAFAAWLAVPADAPAATWKTGVYEGTIDSERGERPKTDIRLRITDRRIKLLEAEFILRCDGGRQEEVTVGPSKKERINEGPAGGGFSISEFERTDTYQQDYSLVGGVKKRTAKGLIDATRTYDDPYETCSDLITLEFKAKRR